MQVSQVIIFNGEVISSPVQVTIGYAKPICTTLDHTISPIGKALARKRYSSFCKEVLKHPILAGLMVREVANVVRLESEVMCSKRQRSLLGSKDAKALEEFSWDSLLEEFSTNAPVLLSVVVAAADSKWRRTSSHLVPKCIPPVCMAMAMLLKTRNQHMSLVQAVMSVLLKAGHVSSEVSNVFKSIDFNFDCRLTHD